MHRERDGSDVPNAPFVFTSIDTGLVKLFANAVVFMVINAAQRAPRPRITNPVESA
ncbi:hypothetical protein BN2476_60014 [Paraburkholderia piptadeniae]|uniref:Uncharacterized protein n=1 Tax=Paraburkholderia piptadeniae TaxID=1701573 RepID=A0A1N7RKW6_9BURK|nr:hypothetical protein [Paraburkholderia piptadeniae]SIT35739.1 hypothetical protein BN2476_60014 [Paraburkholderia piptadeniae]